MNEITFLKVGGADNNNIRPRILNNNCTIDYNENYN